MVRLRKNPNSKYHVLPDSVADLNGNEGDEVNQPKAEKKNLKKYGLNLAGKILLFDQQVSSISKKLLRPDNTIVHLSLSRNKLKDKNCEKLVSVLQDCGSNLTSLDVSHNNFSAEGLAELLSVFAKHEEKKLVSLDISNNTEVKPENLDVLTEQLLCCEALSVLRAAHLGIGEDKLPGFLLDLGFEAPQLNVVDVRGNFHRPGRRATNLVASALAELALLPGLQQLNVMGHWLQLDEARYADVLNLSRCGLTENEILLVLEIFRVNDILQVLDLSDNGWNGDIIGEILHRLEGHPTLLELYLNGNDVHSERILFESVFWNECDLEKFCISSEVWEVQDLKGANAEVTEIDLGGADLTGLDKVVLARLLETNVTLTSLNGLELPPGDDHFDFAASPLALYEFVFLCQRVLLHTHIESISFAFCGLDSKCVSYLAESFREHKSLVRVDLENNSIGDPGFVLLASALMENVSLKDLNLAHNDAGHRGIERLCQALAVNPKLALRSLDLSGNHFNRAAFAALAGVTRAKGATLERLGLDFTGARDPDVTAAFQGVDPLSFKLAELRLAEHALGDAGAAALAEQLRTWQVAHLDLGGGGGDDGGGGGGRLGPAAAAALGGLARDNRALRALHLANCGLGDAGAGALAPLLAANASLTELNLARNGVHGGGAALLADHLKGNAALAVLSLEGNAVGDEGAMAFAQCLQMNTGITYLNLASNGIGEAGAASFLKLMEMKTYSPDFTFLRLTHNVFPDDIMIRLHELSEFPITVDCGHEDTF